MWDYLIITKNMFSSVPADYRITPKLISITFDSGKYCL